MDDSKLNESKLSGKTVFEGKLLNIEHWQVALPDGRVALREIAVHRGAVAIVPLDAAGNVTLVRQYRPALGRNTLEIPAGLLTGPDERALDAAKRELREETGLRALEWRKLCRMAPSPGYLTEKITIFLARKLSEGETDFDEDEFLKSEKYPLRAMVDLVMRGALEDAKTQLGIMLAARELGI